MIDDDDDDYLAVSMVKSIAIQSKYMEAAIERTKCKSLPYYWYSVLPSALDVSLEWYAFCLAVRPELKSSKLWDDICDWTYSPDMYGSSKSQIADKIPYWTWVHYGPDWS